MNPRKHDNRQISCWGDEKPLMLTTYALNWRKLLNEMKVNDKVFLSFLSGKKKIEHMGDICGNLAERKLLFVGNGRKFSLQWILHKFNENKLHFSFFFFFSSFPPFNLINKYTHHPFTHFNILHIVRQQPWGWWEIFCGWLLEKSSARIISLKVFHKKISAFLGVEKF